MHRVIGIKNLDYESKKTGRRVQGVNLYCTYENSAVDGLACESIYLSNVKLSEFGWKPVVGDIFVPVYNRVGNIDKIELE